MALINCPNCGNLISDQASTCPKCGIQLSVSNIQYNGETHVCPKTYMTEAILVTIFCCLPLGIVGIINASKVSSNFLSGHYEEAVIASEQAKKFTTIAFWCGLAMSVIYFFISFLTALQ